MRKLRRGIVIGTLLAGALIPGAAHAQHDDVQQLSAGGATGRVGVDAAGNATAVWVDAPASYSIRYAVRAPDGSFGFVRSVRGVGTVSELAFAESDNGNAIIGWTEGGLMRVSIRSGSAPGFSAARSVGGGTAVADAAGFPAVAISDSGRAVVAWAEGPDERIRAALGTKTSFAAPSTLAAAANDADEPEVGIDSSGAAIVVWEQRGASTQVQSASAPAGGGFGAPGTVADLSQSFTSAPELAVNTTGDALVAYRDGSDLTVRNGSVAGTFAGPQVIAGETYDFEVALDDSGVGALVTGLIMGSDPSLAGAVSNPGGVFGDLQTISDAAAVSGPTVDERAMAIAAGGGEFTVWFANDHEGTGATNAAYSAATVDGVFGAVHRLSPTDADADSVDSLDGASSSDGAHDVGTWSLWDGDGYVVQAAPVVPDTVVPTATTGARPDPYDAGDGRLKVSVTPSEDVRATVVITRKGAKVATLMKKKLLWGDQQSLASWNGKVGKKKAAPGTYRFKVTLVDAAGNRGKSGGSFEVR